MSNVTELPTRKGEPTAKEWAAGLARYRGGYLDDLYYKVAEIQQCIEKEWDLPLDPASANIICGYLNLIVRELQQQAKEHTTPPQEK